MAFASALACSSNGAIDVKLLFRVDKGGVQRGLLSLWSKSLGDKIQMQISFLQKGSDDLVEDVKMLLDRELDEPPELPPPPLLLPPLLPPKILLIKAPIARPPPPPLPPPLPPLPSIWQIVKTKRRRPKAVDIFIFTLV